MNELAVVQNEAQPPLIEHFERCKPWLEAALEEGFYKIEDVARALAENRAQFWPGKNAAIVTEIDTIGQTRVCRVWLAGGEMTEVLEMARGLEAWSRLQGCSEVLVEGRKGWEKALKDQGYEFFTIMLKKAL